MGKTEFDTSVSKLEYVKNDSNICCFSSLDYSLFESEIVAAEAILGHITESLVCQSNGYYDRIRFANAILLKQSQKKGNQHLHYRIK